RAAPARDQIVEIVGPDPRCYLGAMVPALIVHGGAGANPDDRPAYRAVVKAALVAGWARLQGGGSAVGAVQAAVEGREDDPLRNAGGGPALTEEGPGECAASLMEGEGLGAGAVGAVSGVPNPIGLARRILEDGRHILLVGPGAVAFAHAQGVPLCDPDRLVTDHQRGRLQERLAERHATGAEVPGSASASSGTVGAVAIDSHGLIGAGTSPA